MASVRKDARSMAGPTLKSKETSSHSRFRAARPVDPKCPGVELQDGSSLMKRGQSAVVAMNDYYVRARSAFRNLGLNWPIVIWIAMVHVLAVLAPFYFTWPALVTCIALA